MRATDLDLRELLDFEPQGGVIKFGGERAVILDAVALGMLRKQLIHTLGVTGARGVLTRFGYAHGWRTAETMRGAFPWDSEEEWRKAGGRLHKLQGLVGFEPAPAPSDRPRPYAEGVWHDSFEAEQHLLHVGQSEEAVCWMLCGFASGYLSFAASKPIYCVEERCRGKGDAVCMMVGKPREEWGEERAADFAYFESDCLNHMLSHVTEQLKEAEKKLRNVARRVEKARLREEEMAPGLVAKSDAMRRIVDLARRVAKVDSTVLVTGESGVGKEVVARLIHEESARVAGPFVAVNCGAVPEGLLESELFGHARGAFTGAMQDRAGLFEAAAGGTILLDEMGEVPPSMQVKLLRALQEREIRRVGENRNRPIDVRVVAATNRDLAADVQSGRFRQDLFYRLRVVEIRIPALRERKEDVLPLARSFLERASRKLARKVSSLSPEAAAQLVRYDWPGNVRELENLMERAVVLATGTRVELADLPEEVMSALPVAFVPGELRSLEDVERDYILAVLRATDGNKAKAAQQLKIGTATLFRKLKQYEKDGLRH